MSYFDRRNFLNTFFLAGLSYSPVIKNASFFLSAGGKKTVPFSEHADQEPSTDPYIVDLHCHPNMKNYLLGLHMWECNGHTDSKGPNNFNMQVDICKLKEGNVRGLLAAHHLPERGMKEQAYTFRRIFPFVKSIAPVFASKLENGDASNFRQLTTMMDDFEEHIRRLNEIEGGNCIKIAKSFREFKEITNNGNTTIAVAQSIEGIHALGRDLSAEQYIERLNFLADRGICLITLSHFFANDISYPVEGIAPSEKKSLKFTWRYHPAYDNRPLTEIGKKVVWQMLLRGIVVDLTHLTPAGRNNVYELNELFFNNFGRRRPLIFTHTGVEDVVNAHHPLLENYKYMAASKYDIEQIQKCDGVIGIVFMNFWLTGNDTHTNSGDGYKFKNGINYIVETIKKIQELTGSYRHVALGSDFDGFADAPSDLRNPSYYNKLIAKIKDIPAITAQDLNAITHANSLRVLENGWG